MNGKKIGAAWTGLQAEWPELCLKLWVWHEWNGIMDTHQARLVYRLCGQCKTLWGWGWCQQINFSSPASLDLGTNVHPGLSLYSAVRPAPWSCMWAKLGGWCGMGRVELVWLTRLVWCTGCATRGDPGGVRITKMVLIRFKKNVLKCKIQFKCFYFYISVL